MVIQEALLKGFYRAYPEPRGGKLNPLNLPPEAAGAGISIFSDAPPERPGPRLVNDTTSEPARPPSDSAPRLVADTSGGGTGASTGPRLVSSAVDSAPVAASGPRVVGAGAATPVIATPENVIMPSDAAPEMHLDRAAVRAQVVLTYSRYFMSQAAREALMEFRPLPAGDAAFNSAFTHPVNRIDQITDAIMERYDYLRANKPTELATLWDAQRERGFLTRHGVPDGLITREGGRMITEWANDARVAEFGADAPALYEREARNRHGNTETYRRGLIDMLRDPVRMAGR